MASKKPPIAGLVDLFSDEFGALAPAVIRDIRRALKDGKSVRAAVQQALAGNGITSKIEAAILDKLVTAAAIGFGVAPELVVDPVGIRKSFLNATWPGDELTLSQRLASQEYRQVIIDTISAQMARGRTWQETADALVRPLQAGGQSLVRGDVAQRFEDLADAARRVAAGDNEALKAFKGELAAARRHVDRLGRNGAPNQALKAIYKQVTDAAEDHNQNALDRAIRQAVADRARYNAERIARTEIARAYGAGEDLAQTQDTDVIAERILLSSRHPEPDICNFHAQADLYGMGPGVYPVNRKPPYPFHPHCMCIKVRVYKGEVEPSDKMDPDAGARYLAGLSPEARKHMLGVEGSEAFAKNPGAWQKHLRGWQGHHPPARPRGLKPEMFTGPEGHKELPRAEQLQEKVAILERRIRKQRFESAAAWDADGNLLLFKDGQQSSVSFSNSEIQRIRGSVFTHNHPGGWRHPEDDPRRGGNSFSIDDMAVATKAQLKEIRAASPLYNHSMKPPAGGWDEEFFRSSIYPTYRRVEMQVQSEGILAIRAGFKTMAQAEADFYHDVWTRVSRELGLIYERVKAPE